MTDDDYFEQSKKLQRDVKAAALALANFRGTLAEKLKVKERLNSAREDLRLHRLNRWGDE